MMTREEALEFGMSFPNVYEERPFRDPNWQLVRVKGSKKAFLWIYEREGYTNLNVKVDPEWRDFCASIGIINSLPEIIFQLLYAIRQFFSTQP